MPRRTSAWRRLTDGSKYLMKLPEMINLQLRGSEDADLSDIIVLLEVRAGRKNPYFIAFPKTDATGRAHISDWDFVAQFEDHWKRGLMDYNGSVADSDPRVELSLFDVRRYRADRDSAMIWPLTQHERKQWKSRDERYRYYTSCRNDLFFAEPIIVDLESNHSIQLELRKFNRQQ